MDKYKYIALLALAGLGVFFFYEYIWHIIGLYLGGNELLRQKSKKHQTVADEHEELMYADLNESAEHIEDARESNEKAVEIASDDTEPKYKDLPSRFKRKVISSE